MENLVKVKNKDTNDILYMIKNAPSRFIEGDEYVRVKRFPDAKLWNYIKRKSLIFHWKE